MSQQQIWIVYGDRDFNGGFSNVFYSQDEAHQWIAELLEIDSFDGSFEESDALEAYENGKWKCLECDCHTIDWDDLHNLGDSGMFFPTTTSDALDILLGEHGVIEVVDALAIALSDRVDSLDSLDEDTQEIAQCEMLIAALRHWQRNVVDTPEAPEIPAGLADSRAIGERTAAGREANRILAKERSLSDEAKTRMKVAIRAAKNR